MEKVETQSEPRRQWEALLRSDGWRSPAVMGIKQAQSPRPCSFNPLYKKFQTSCTQPTHAKQKRECGLIRGVSVSLQFQASYTWAPFNPSQVLIVAPAHGLKRAVGTVCRATT